MLCIRSILVSGDGGVQVIQPMEDSGAEHPPELGGEAGELFVGEVRGET